MTHRQNGLLGSAESTLIYHWTTYSKALTALNRNSLAQRRWTHYLEEGERFAKGTSWSKSPTRWENDCDVCFVLDRAKIPNIVHSINAERTYLLTQGLLRKDFDLNAYMHESTEPTEEFVEGKIAPFVPALVALWVRGPKATMLQKLGQQLEIPVVRRLTDVTENTSI